MIHGKISHRIEAKTNVSLKGYEEIEKSMREGKNFKIVAITSNRQKEDIIEIELKFEEVWE